MPGKATVEIHGAALRNPWTLLTANANAGTSQLTVEHDISDWKSGDKVTIAAQGNKHRNTETFGIQSINGNTITLDGQLQAPRLGRKDKFLQAEVMNMSRNILVTGDGFNSADHGIHMIFNSYARISGTRVEKCGQKNIKGRYCMHFHQVRDCPECLFYGNVADDGSQRGFVVHGTHQAQVRDNIVHKVKGAGIYVEDGNELYNTFAYNVNICHEKDGCILRGATDNGRADEGEQSGFWLQSSTNHLIYNRVANHKHGIFFDGALSGKGRGMASGKVCNTHDEYGIVKGNVNHSNNLFGMYYHTAWPRKVRRSIASNGYVEDMDECNANRWCSCDALKPDGTDNGASATIEDTLDYSNNWSGGYSYGDIQYKGFHAINNLHGIYWKITKPFADGRIGHVIDSKFETTSGHESDVLGGGYAVVHILQPGGLGAFQVRNTEFTGNAGQDIAAAHHCEVGGHTGALCTPEIDLKDITWDNDWKISFGFTSTRYAKTLPIFTSSDASLGTNWPVTSLASEDQTHLLGLNGCSKTTDKHYDDGIICNKALRRLQVWSQDQGNMSISPKSYSAGATTMEYMKGGGNARVGYGAVVASGETYRLKLNQIRPKKNGKEIPVVLEFSDIMYQNESITLEIEYNGRVETCVLSSQDPRNWLNYNGPIFDGVENPNNTHPGACVPQLKRLGA
jgi:hypothetical protein